MHFPASQVNHGGFHEVSINLFACVNTGLQHQPKEIQQPRSRDKKYTSAQSALTPGYGAGGVESGHFLLSALKEETRETCVSVKCAGLFYIMKIH